MKCLEKCFIFFFFFFFFLLYFLKITNDSNIANLQRKVHISKKILRCHKFYMKMLDSNSIIDKNNLHNTKNEKIRN